MKPKSRKMNTEESFLNKKKTFQAILTVIFACFSLRLGFCQEPYFRSPLDIPLQAAAYFGDVRSNHFHSGLDLRTQQTEGKNIYAVADGFVSRIRISAYGFGYALYLDHPDGHTSVYGHMQRYSERIAAFAIKKQTEKETFELDIKLNPGDLPVKKGEIIGLSGNSGSSEGPHLHFELRNTKTEEILNPMTLGIQFPDHKAPVIKRLFIYKKDGYEAWHSKQTLPVAGSGTKYYCTSPMPLRIEGRFGIGIQSEDWDDVSGGPEGFYSLEMQLDGKTVFKQELDQFSFSETRYVNSSIDYEQKIATGKVSQFCFLQPGNQMTIFKEKKNAGILDFPDSSLHIIRIEVKDFFGNSSAIQLFIQGKLPRPIKPKQATNYTRLFPFGVANHFENDAVKVDIPAGYLYDTLAFQYSRRPGTDRMLSDVHAIHNRKTPVHGYYELSIKADIPTRLQSKACVVNVNDNLVAIYEGGTYKDGAVTVSTKTFGNFAVMLDTVSPRVNPLNIKAGRRIASGTNLRFGMTDNLSGIKTYRGTLDGKWILLVHEGKNNTLSFSVPSGIARGKHAFQIELTDRCGNTSVYTTSLLF